jgi:general stress protein YciG
MTSQSRRGFASMSVEKRRAIASKGGKAAHAHGGAHEFTPEEARLAGRKGGVAAHARGVAHKFTPEEARAAGHKGGLARGAARAASASATDTRNEPSVPPASPALTAGIMVSP